MVRSIIIIILCAVSVSAQTNRIIYEQMLDSLLTVSPNIDSIEANIDTLTQDITFTGAIDVDGLATFDSLTASLGASITGNLDVDGLTILDSVQASQGATFSGNVNITGMVRQTDTWHAYGGFQDSAITIALDADTWTMITNSGNNLWGGEEADGLTLANDTMVIANTGDYVGNVSISISALNGKDYQFRVYNVTQDDSTYYIGVTTSGANNYMTMPLPLYLECTANDSLVMQIRCTDGTDPVLKHAVFYLAYLHD